MNEESEFGKGLTICLIKFAEHLNDSLSRQIRDVAFWHDELKENDEKLRQYDRRVQENVKVFKKVYLETRKNYEEAISDLIKLWASGASDHLYEIEVPKCFKNTLVEDAIKALQKKAINMRSMNALLSLKDIDKLWDLTYKIALEIDKELGLKPQIGKW
ncbi:MAG: hypothetical protein J7L14_03550 [Candidatus Diapherotrites archaeon]|nr:hypothetical protein [Candidatus Diapherotrites archaeon]